MEMSTGVSWGRDGHVGIKREGVIVEGFTTTPYSVLIFDALVFGLAMNGVWTDCAMSNHGWSRIG